MSVCVAPLPDRGVVRVSGPDARRLLHDLLTADVAGLAPGEARLAALLSPQGKILFDFLIVCQASDAFLLDIARDAAEAFSKRLLLYRLRARMEVAELADTRVAAVWGGTPEGAPGLAFRDPRLSDLGTRVVAPSLDLEAWLADRTVEPAESYLAHRVALGIAEGGRDYPLGDTFPHEACLDQLGGVDFRKGCYVGQEVVSRMEHRGTARTRAVPVRLEGEALPGEPVTAAGRLAGRIGSVAGECALALLRLDRVAEALATSAPVTAGQARLTLVKPTWARFPFPGEPGFGARPDDGIAP